ncbi:MAG: Rpn family recombination-promoting nuclease/putative transposase [Okeania sp. SIO2G4]|uniref:Rpn family recombination-promoting nuclease/putative transposase n=1 Tax=unclassified Okeania TaxID=2634635 RepID=UPI0013BA61F8|nr:MULTISPECIES: Rpn family recombination-promoting nuclease/putative transposase [unclassified Okeania]NEP70929.1 Rpn family recombination-promoting nuclease/putative transposase [Okeania sp. SIO2G5]NEP92291.1 Rpn family recombination-promoting nuclease/putative transposase [Okeania sp. SIO2F5]NEQ89981.1 Rpn family recombination-promoting nuclease/putative transposase [Okeania sp. SIO2G4]
MKFINPKVDYAFKKIFGSEQSKEILISFLNAIIYDGEKTIKDLTIVNPFNPGQIISFKDTYLDIKAVLFDGSIVVIEMQVARMTAFSKRVMYNLVKGYGNQLETGDDYPLLRPAIAVTITDFILFKDKIDVINPFVFKHREKNWEYPDRELQLIFVELPKFKKTLGELKTLADKWIYFLKEAAKFDDIPDSLGEVAEIELALNIAERINMTSEELEIVERRAIALQDEKGRLIYAEEQGEAKGRLNQAIALVKLLITQRFGEVSKDINSQIEDLPLADVEDLVKVFLSFNSLVDLESWLQERL